MYKILLASVFLLSVIGVADSQDKKKDMPKIDLKMPTQATGKEMKHKVSELKKFDKPVVIHPHHKPPEKKGGSWHWHQWHGWVFLTANAPTTVLLPLSYTLPETVILYVPEPSYISVTCPHCGQIFQVQIK